MNGVNDHNTMNGSNAYPTLLPWKEGAMVTNRKDPPWSEGGSPMFHGGLLLALGIVLLLTARLAALGILPSPREVAEHTNEICK